MVGENKFKNKTTLVRVFCEMQFYLITILNTKLKNVLVPGEFFLPVEFLCSIFRN